VFFHNQFKCYDAIFFENKSVIYGFVPANVDVLVDIGDVGKQTSMV